MTAGAARRVWIAPGPLEPTARRAFGDMVPYCLPDGADGLVTAGRRPAVEFSAVDGTAAVIERLLATAFERSAGAPEPVVEVLHDQWDLPARPVAVQHAAKRVGRGLFVADPEVARLVWELDTVLRDVALALGAAEHATPAMVDWSTLDRAGYPANFPQHVLPVEVVGPDLAALDRFALASTDDDRDAELRRCGLCLTPAVCLPLFAAHADSTVPGRLLLTARGTCGRHEATATASVLRPWTFTLREIVVIGDLDEVAAFREGALDLLATFAAAVGLPARVVSANDPFFTADRGELTGYQARFAVKHELCGRSAGDSTPLAVASVNFHDQHFGGGFDIRLPDGSPARSACVGFGLERLAYWLHGHLGNETADFLGSARRWCESVGPFG